MDILIDVIPILGLVGLVGGVIFSNYIIHKMMAENNRLEAVLKDKQADIEDLGRALYKVYLVHPELDVFAFSDCVLVRGNPEGSITFTVRTNFETQLRFEFLVDGSRVQTTSPRDISRAFKK